MAQVTHFPEFPKLPDRERRDSRFPDNPLGDREPGALNGAGPSRSGGPERNEA